MSAPTTTPARAMSVELCTDERTFAALSEEWARLHGACPSATPFQSHAWLHSWWLSYGTPDGLRLFLVRRDGELVAAAPLMRVRHPLPKLVPIGGAISDFCDVLIDESAAEQGSVALADALAGAARTALIDFREVRPGSAVEQVYRHWRGPRRRLQDSACLELPAVPMTELVKRLPPARAQRVRNKINRCGKVGVEWRGVSPDETETALRRLIDLHRLQWEGKKMTPEHIRPRFLEHLVRSVVPMARSGQATLTEFLLDGAVVAVNLHLLSGGLAGQYLYGFHPGLRERRVDVATMLLRASTERLASGGESRVLSLLRGDEPYKYRWNPDTVVNQRLLLAGLRTLPLLAATLCDVAARCGARKVRRIRPDTKEHW
ncbi:GNAT family N-acetyltransferase [Streptomyces sp. NPDC047043]|uniref:GNAT family N-acetyltransferase n=1 Tax=Streptomyces sp. NPDC047043 TaxID=3154497 RepID=UPI0033CD9603